MIFHSSDIDIGFAVLEYGSMLHISPVVPWTWRTIASSVDLLSRILIIASHFPVSFKVGSCDQADFEVLHDFCNDPWDPEIALACFIFIS